MLTTDTGPGNPSKHSHGRLTKQGKTDITTNMREMVCGNEDGSKWFKIESNCSLRN